jgi:hypothetical protein
MEFISGATLGFTKIMIGYPFDTVKSRMQVNKNLNYLELMYNGNKSILNLYKGFELPLIANSLKRGTQYYTFEQMNSLTSSTYLSGFIAGGVSSVITNPVNVIKNKIQTGEGTGNSSFGLLKTVISEGKLFKGLSQSILRDSLFSGVYLGVYGYFREKFPKTPYYYSISGLIAGISSWVVLMPFDTYRTMVQAEKMDNLKAVRKNPLILWRGLSVMLIRSGPINMINMVIYEYIKNINL